MKRSMFVLTTIFSLTGSLYVYSHTQMSQNHESSLDFTRHYREIHTDTLNSLIRSGNPSLVIVDARLPENDDGKRIPGAKAIPTNASIENINANLPNKDAMIVVYCSNAKCPASELLANRLSRMGYQNVWRYTGGLEEWETNGQKIEKGKMAPQITQEKRT